VASLRGPFLKVGEGEVAGPTDPHPAAEEGVAGSGIEDQNLLASVHLLLQLVDRNPIAALLREYRGEWNQCQNRARP
jgi:hypothetical protein